MIKGLIVLLNMMPGKAYVGVHLNSGGCIHALKGLIEEDYDRFCDEFRASGLADSMGRGTYEEKLDTAWGVYARKKLADMGFNQDWERAYLELDEFEMFLGSMSVFHFGSRYPCFSRPEPIPLDWWHLRLHMYVGNKFLRADRIVDPEKAYLNCKAGADVIVVGNAIEKDSSLIREMADAVHSVPALV
jgi:hypothetical protein